MGDLMLCYLALLASYTFFPVSADLLPGQRVEVFEAVWNAVNDSFYDPHFRGIDWASLRETERERFRDARDDREVKQLIRGLLARLRNSHLGYSSPEDGRLRQGTLPFLFERTGDRVFVIESSNLLLHAGDEIVLVDGKPATALQLPLPRYIRALAENPYMGEPGSLAVLEVARQGRQTEVRVERVKRGEAFSAWRLERPEEGIVCLKLRQIPRGEELHKLLDASRSAHGLILDLRNCTGGFLESSLPMVSFLLGAGLDFYQIRPRRSQAVRTYQSDPKTADVSALVEQGFAVQVRTYDCGLRFTGAVAVLVNEFTASEGETIAAALKEYKRDRVFGSRTNGAFNGWSQAVGLPHGFGTVAVPTTSTLTALGIDLEGIGVEPDEAVTNSPEDLRAGRDQVLAKALVFVRAPTSGNPAARGNEMATVGPGKRTQSPPDPSVKGITACSSGRRTGAGFLMGRH